MQFLESKRAGVQFGSNVIFGLLISRLKTHLKNVNLLKKHPYIEVEAHKQEYESEATSMKTMIYCKTPKKGVHAFYMVNEGETYYLFSQDYRRGVQVFYHRGVRLDESLDYSKAHRDAAIERTMSKIPMYIKYIEKEYGIEVLERTKKKNRYGSNNLRICA